MKDDNYTFDELKSLSKMESKRDIEEFEKAVWGLVSQGTPDILDKLIQLFYDECPFREVMYSLVHAIETFPDELYVQGILRNIKFLLSSPHWAKTLIYGILNNPNCLKLFKSNMDIADMNSLLLLSDTIEKESPYHAQLIRELRDELTKKK